MCCFCAAGKPEKPRKMYSTKLLKRLFVEEMALKLHLVHKLGNNQVYGDEANQDSIVASQDCVVAQEVEDVALEVIQLERDKLDELLKLCQHEDNYLCSIM